MEPPTPRLEAEQSTVASSRRPITPLWVITLFVSLSETVTGIAVTQASGGIQVALTAFVIAFPILVATAFFVVLWNRPYVFYAPTEFGRATDVGLYVEAMQRRNATEARSYDQVQEAVRSAVSSPEILNQLKAVVGTHVDVAADRGLRQVLDRVAAAAVRNVEQRFIAVDTSPILGARGGVRRIPFNPEVTVFEFLDDLWFSFSGHVPAYSYGTSWVLKDMATGALIMDAGRTWARQHNQAEDTRSLADIGLGPGMRLQAVRLEKAL